MKGEKIVHTYRLTQAHTQPSQAQISHGAVPISPAQDKGLIGLTLLEAGRDQSQQGGSDLLWEGFGHLACRATPACKLPSTLSPLPLYESRELQSRRELSSIPHAKTSICRPSSVARGSMKMLEGSLRAEAPRRSNSDLTPFPGVTWLVKGAHPWLGRRRRID